MKSLLFSELRHSQLRQLYCGFGLAGSLWKELDPVKAHRPRFSLGVLKLNPAIRCTIRLPNRDPRKKIRRRLQSVITPGGNREIDAHRRIGTASLDQAYQTRHNETNFVRRLTFDPVCIVGSDDEMIR